MVRSAMWLQSTIEEETVEFKRMLERMEESTVVGWVPRLLSHA